MSTDGADDHRAEALARLAALERSLGDLTQALRGGVARLQAEVEGLRSSIEEIPVPEQPVAADANTDADGARIVALDLMLRGTPRDEAVLRLAADYPGVDAAALLDEARATLDS